MTEVIPDSWHAKLSASSASRWMACPGSVKLSQGAPSGSSEYAAEGTYAHHIAAECLASTQPGVFSKTPEDWLGVFKEVDGHVIECTQDMVDAVNVYLEEVFQFLRTDDIIMVEQDLTRR